jgi:hypothetical protein
MASSPLAQIDASSIDQAGISVVTTTKSATNSRFGSIYDPTILAAGVPVHVHPMTNGTQFLVAFAQRWTAATASQTQPGFYSAYTIDPTPTWFLTDQTGARTSLGNTPAVPVVTPATSLTLRDGTGKAPDYLYLLHTATTGGVSNGLLQHFRVTSQGGVSAVNEEVIPNLASPAVTFDKGVDYNTTNITVYGTDASGNVYMARKPSGAVGASSTTDPKTNLTTSLGWQYFTGTGWSAKPTDAAPVSGLTSNGPVSVATYGNYRYISTVQASGPVMSAQVFSRYLGAKPGWQAQGSSVALGSTADGSYLGGTLQLQPLLLASASTVNSPASATAIPAVASIKSRVSSQDTLAVTWSALQIPRQS